MDTTQTVTHIGLCAGYGGIELGLARVLPTLRSVALCEIEAFPIANLVAKMEAGLMESAPIWTDLKTFPWESFRDRVDILTGGYPCQPFSAAGKRAGKEDPRHLWPWIADGIRILRPRVCFFENVEGHISLGLSSVISDLEELGYKVSWGIFSASEVGAPHQRKRVFILAHSADQRPEWSSIIRSPSTSEAVEGCGAWSWPSRPGEPQHGWEPPRVVANAISGRGLSTGSQCRSSEMAGDSGCKESAGHQQAAFLNNQGCDGRGEETGTLGDSTHQRDINAPQQDHSEAGADTDRASEGAREDVANSVRSRGEEPEHLNANLPTEPSGRDTEGLGNAMQSRPSSEWSSRGQQDGLGQPSGAMGNTNSPRPQERQGQRGAGIQGTHADGGEDAERQAQPSMGRDADGASGGLGYAELCVSCDNRTDELRLLGNGVVPATAERAFRTLLTELLTNKTNI